MVTIDRERLISERQNNKASAEGAKLPKGAMLLRDIHKAISGRVLSYIYIYIQYVHTRVGTA